MEEETYSRRGWNGGWGGGERCILKIVIAKGGVQFSYVITLGRKVLIHHTWLKAPAPHWDVINERSIKISHCSQSPGSDG